MTSHDVMEHSAMRYARAVASHPKIVPELSDYLYDITGCSAMGYSGAEARE